MFQLDDQFLQDVGLGALPAEQKANVSWIIFVSSLNYALVHGLVKA